MFCYDPSPVIKVVYVLLYQTFCHACGLYLVLEGTVLCLCDVIYCVLVVGIFVCALYYPIFVCDFTHLYKCDATVQENRCVNYNDSPHHLAHLTL